MRRPRRRTRDHCRRGAGAPALTGRPRLAFVDGPVVTRDPTALAWLVYLVEPVTAAVAAALVLDEPLERVAVLGILLILGAVAGLGRPTTAAGPVALGPDVS